ncbi:unnamed protein product [Paramecium sonneborni]|uniref:Ubiquitin-like protease family profile domain-containing protein n=1 Tax=Paramecium sonneborni TaxID=65129 RepID=A0A8S1KSN5_9CILI|nr:unnamed protein product [Paramecium sonneborni]
MSEGQKTMGTEIKEPFNFQQYVDWAFEQNKGTYIYKTQNEQSLTKTNYFTTQIRDEQINGIIWLFRKCQTISEIDNQNKAFLEHQHILRHVFLFLLILVKKYKDQRKIYALMNSTGILFENEELKLCIPNEKFDILQQTYYKKDFDNIGAHLTENCKSILERWAELKNEPNDFNFGLPKSDKEFLNDFPRISACLNLKQNIKLIEQKKQKEEGKKMLEKLQKERLFQSSLRKEQIQFVQLVKVVNHKKPNYLNQSLILQPNGNLIIGKIWFPNNQTDLCPLWLSYNFQVQSYNHLNNFNQELKQYIGFLTYTGPVNDYFEPQTYDYNEETEGIMQTNNQHELIMKGGFKNGLFEGKKNRIYIGCILIFYGSFKNGQKHGEGYELNQQFQTFFRGLYESNQKQGIFVDCKLINYQNREKEFSKIGSRQEYYKNNIKYNQIPEWAQQVYNVNQNPACVLLNFNEYGINNFQLSSLRPGGWINSSLIDILLQQQISLVNYSNIINQNKQGNKMKTLFLNCSQCQDIFGSMITKNDDINDLIFQEAFLKHQESCNQEKVQSNKKNMRIVFYLNLDRSHFLSVVYDNEKLYIIDSLNDTREPLKFQMKKLLMKYQFHVEDKDDVTLSQQQNSFDCGVYTIYYVSQFIKNQNLTIKEMIDKQCFKVSQSKVNYIRYLIYQNLVGNGASIMEL